jgi:5-methylcytosine-specific restriction protein A
MLPTYVFAWNPKLWNWPELPDDMRRLRRRGHVDHEWSSGRAKQIEPGSRAYFHRLGVPPKGLIGAGYTLTAPESRAHWRPEKAAQGTQTCFLQLRLEFLTDLPLITFEELARPPFSRFRWGVRQSGVRRPSTIAHAIVPWWAERVEAFEAQRAGKARRARR